MSKRDLTSMKVYSGMTKKTKADVFKGLPDDKSSFAAMEFTASGQQAKFLAKGATRYRVFLED